MTQGDYIRTFEERTGESARDYNFLETVNNSLRSNKH